MAAAPASAVHAPHVPTTAVQHHAPGGEMMSRGHRAGTMKIDRLADHPAIGRNAPDHRAATNALAATIVDVTSVHRVGAAPVTAPLSGTTAVVMTVRQAAGLPAGMMIGPPTVIAERGMNGRTTQANQGALTKELTIASARRSAQDRARAHGPVRRVVAKAINVPSASAPGPTVITPATGQDKEVAGRLPANKNSFPDRSG